MEEDDYEYNDNSNSSRNTKQDDEETEDETPKDDLVNEKRGYSSQEKAMIEEWLRQNRPAGDEQ